MPPLNGMAGFGSEGFFTFAPGMTGMAGFFGGLTPPKVFIFTDCPRVARRLMATG